MKTATPQPCHITHNGAIALEPTLGDTNAEGLVNIDNLKEVRNNFGAMGPDGGTLDGNAFPFDGMANIDDLNAVSNNFGAVAAQAVPEPGAFMLVATCGSAAPLSRRRCALRHGLGK